MNPENYEYKPEKVVEVPEAVETNEAPAEPSATAPETPAPRFQPPSGYTGATSTNPVSTPPAWVGSTPPFPPVPPRASRPYSPSPAAFRESPPPPVIDPTQAELYRRAEARVRAKMHFYRHLTSYVLVNALLWFIAVTTWITTTHGSIWTLIWPIWVTVFWGIGLISDFIKTFGFGEHTTQRMIEEEMRKMQR